MKKPLILCTVFSAIALITFAQVAPKTIENVQVTATADLKADEVKFYVHEFTLDRQLTLAVEARKASGVLVDRTLVKLTAAQVKTWVNDADPDAWLKNHVLSVVGLTVKK